MPKLKGELRPAHGNTVLCLSRKTIIEDVIVDIASRELSSIFTQYLSRNGISGGISQGYCFNSCALSFPPRDISLTSNRIQGDIATAWRYLVWTERDIVASPRLSFSLKSVIFPTKGSNDKETLHLSVNFPCEFQKTRCFKSIWNLVTRNQIRSKSSHAFPNESDCCMPLSRPLE